jgi:tetratricopeptide (TPR) repeat protein
MHFSMLTLVPSLLVLGSSAGGGAGRRGALVRGGAWMLVALGAAAALLIAIGFDARAYLNVPRDSVAPLTGELGFRHNWHLLSAAHASDVLNQILLVTPAALLALPLLIRSRRDERVADPATSPTDRFLAAAAAVPVAFALIANPEVGAFRDWDVFALPGLALNAWVAARVASAGGARQRSVSAAAIVVSACALHTIAWTSLNADSARAERRFERLLETATLSRHARSYGWESLGSLRRDRGDAEAAAEAWDLAARHAVRNVRLWNAAAEAHLKLGRTSRASEAWSRALDAEPRNPDAQFGLGALAFRAQDYAEAARRFEAAIAARPDFALAHYNLGLARLRSNDESGAMTSLTEAVRADPGFALGWETLGAVHRSAGHLEEARRCFEASLATRPAGPEAERVRGWLRRLSEP